MNSISCKAESPKKLIIFKIHTHPRKLDSFGGWYTTLNKLSRRSSQATALGEDVHPEVHAPLELQLTTSQQVRKLVPFVKKTLFIYQDSFIEKSIRILDQSRDG
jgi:hypothetical protein